MSKTSTATPSDKAPLALPSPDATTTAPAAAPANGLKSMMSHTQDFVAFGKANAEAVVASGKIWVAGVQDLTKQAAETAKATYEESVATVKAVGTVKSLQEAIELQKTFTKTLIGIAMAESKKLTEGSIKLAEQVVAPLTARVTAAAETFGKAA